MCACVYISPIHWSQSSATLNLFYMYKIHLKKYKHTMARVAMNEDAFCAHASNIHTQTWKKN